MSIVEIIRKIQARLDMIDSRFPYAKIHTDKINEYLREYRDKDVEQIIRNRIKMLLDSCQCGVIDKVCGQCHTRWVLEDVLKEIGQK